MPIERVSNSLPKVGFSSSKIALMRSKSLRTMLSSSVFDAMVITPRTLMCSIA